MTSKYLSIQLIVIIIISGLLFLTKIQKKKLKKFQKNYTNWCLYSKPKNLTKAKILIIDKVGILKYIYKYANIVYVGGGFQKEFTTV